MAAAGSVPVAPDPALLTEFNARFSDPSQIAAVADSTTSQDLIPQTEIISLREARAGRVKIGKGIVHVQDFFVRYSLAMLAKLGIRRWGPDLEAAPDSMWNEACRLSAIRIFRMWVAGKAFPNANPGYVDDILLLEKTYNHYVHHLMTEKFKKETKDAGKNQRDDARKVIQRNRQRVSQPSALPRFKEQTLILFMSVALQTPLETRRGAQLPGQIHQDVARN